MASDQLHAFEKPRYSKYYVRRGSNRMSEVEDRLSSLPDPILIDIMSRLFIHEAAATSVLSRRWRHLWTGVTRLVFRHASVLRSESDNSLRVIVDILRQLTSPKLTVFGVHVQWFSSTLTIAESCFHELCCRKVESIQITADSRDYRGGIFHAPACLFETQTLVTLHLFCLIQLPDDIATLPLIPKLKSLELETLVKFPSWLGTLLSSCPILEHLKLSFHLFLVRPQPHSDLQIFGPNLKSLHRGMSSPLYTPRAKIIIDAPHLTNLKIIDSTSCYHFVRKPTQLIRAIIEPRISFDVELEQMAVAYREDNAHHMSMFVAGMSSVCKLELQLPLVPLSQNNVYTYLNSLNIEPHTITFPNLVSLQARFDGIGLHGCKDLLLCLHCFPNLSYLRVIMETHRLWEVHNNWCAPNSVPDCLVSKLKTIEITIYYSMTGDELIKLPAYILSNAIVLEKLCLFVWLEGESIEARRQNKLNFCRSLFNLPRGSSSCEIVFSSS